MFDVSIYDLIPQENTLDDGDSNLGSQIDKETAYDSAYAIVTCFRDQGWLSFPYRSGAMFAWILVKPDSALFKLIEVTKG